MDHCIHNSLKHRRKRELRDIDPPGLLDGKHPHVAIHEPDRLKHLDVQRSRYVAGIQLAVRRPLGAAVGHRLNERAVQPIFGVLTGHEQTCDSRAESPIDIGRDKVDFPKKRQVVRCGKRCFETTEKGRRQFHDVRTGDNLLVEAHKSCLSTLLEKTCQGVWREFPLGTANPREIPPDALVDKKALRRFNAKNAATFSADWNFADYAIQPRGNHVVADRAHPSFKDIEFIGRERRRFPDFVINPEEDPARSGVRHCRKFV